MSGWGGVQRLMKLLRVRGMPPEFEVGITFGMGYLVFYVANTPLHLSGVIAVVVYGLFGSATLKWEMSAVASREHFRRFWDVLSQVPRPVHCFTAVALFPPRSTACKRSRSENAPGYNTAAFVVYVGSKERLVRVEFVCVCV